MTGTTNYVQNVTRARPAAKVRVLETPTTFRPRRLFNVIDVDASLAWLGAWQVAAGEDHSLALAEGGSVWSFGNGWYGRLGHGDEAGLLVPRRIEDAGFNS